MNKRRSETFRYWAMCFAVSFLAAGLVAKCKAQTIGVHLATAHFSGGGHTSTLGLYVKLPVGLADGRVQLGAYRNSLTTTERSTSYYIAQAWDFGRYSVALGVVSGYQRKTEYGPSLCPVGYHDSAARRCYRTSGHTRGAFGPLVAASVSWPETQPVVGFIPRLTLFPAGVHLGVERAL